MNTTKKGKEFICMVFTFLSPCTSQGPPHSIILSSPWQSPSDTSSFPSSPSLFCTFLEEVKTTLSSQSQPQINFKIPKHIQSRACSSSFHNILYFCEVPFHLLNVGTLDSTYFRMWFYTVHYSSSVPSAQDPLQSVKKHETMEGWSNQAFQVSHAPLRELSKISWRLEWRYGLDTIFRIYKYEIQFNVFNVPPDYFQVFSICSMAYFPDTL